MEEVILREEQAFNRTLDEGISIFSEVVDARTRFFQVLRKAAEGLGPTIRYLEEHGSLPRTRLAEVRRKLKELGTEVLVFDLVDFARDALQPKRKSAEVLSEEEQAFATHLEKLQQITAKLARTEQPEPEAEQLLPELRVELKALEEFNQTARQQATVFPGAQAFTLYDTYGFPLDLTELMARERGLTVDVAGFDKLMEEQKARARAAQKKQVIELSQVETTTPTRFVGYDRLEAPAKVLEVVEVKDKTAVILDSSPFYAEMGGQVGDTGELERGSELWRVTNTQKAGDAWLHFLADDRGTRNTQHATRSTDAPPIGSEVTLSVDRPRREAIQRHHTVTHLLHWALHEVVSKDATQKGSYVGPEKLTFDFSSAPLTPQQVADVERLVNERILENAPVSWTEVPYKDIRDRKDIMQFFGEKYGDVVRVVQIGGKPAALDGYAMELCGGTHTRATGQIGLFRIAAESAIAAGIRRIEAVSGMEAYRRANEELQLIKTLSGKVNSPVGELEKKIESLLAQQKDLEKQLKAMQQKQAGRNRAQPCRQGPNHRLDPGHHREPRRGRRRFPASHRRCAQGPVQGRRHTRRHDGQRRGPGSHRLP